MSSDTTNEKDELTAAYMAGRESAVDEVRELMARISDYESAYAATLNSPCEDEKHCTCVPHLRRRIAELEAERDGLRNAMHGTVASLSRPISEWDDADPDPTGGHDE